MKAKEVMIKKVISVTEDTTVRDVALVLLKNKFSGLPIINKDKKIVGVVSDKDIFKLLNPGYEEYFVKGDEQVDLSGHIAKVGGTKVSKVMTKKVVTVSPDDSVIKVGAIMMLKKIHRVFVADKNKLVGVISRDDIYPKSLEIFK